MALLGRLRLVHHRAVLSTSTVSLHEFLIPNLHTFS
jgi:hypothetical protein